MMMRKKGTGCCNRPGREPCEVKYTILHGKKHERRTVDDSDYCVGCNAPAGSPHHLGCDHEICPNCSEQVAFGCGCMYVRTVRYETANGTQVEE